jgi:hypothetical protein
MSSSSSSLSSANNKILSLRESAKLANEFLKCKQEAKRLSDDIERSPIKKEIANAVFVALTNEASPAAELHKQLKEKMLDFNERKGFDATFSSKTKSNFNKALELLQEKANAEEQIKLKMRIPDAQVIMTPEEKDMRVSIKTGANEEIYVLPFAFFDQCFSFFSLNGPRGEATRLRDNLQLFLQRAVSSPHNTASYVTSVLTRTTPSDLHTNQSSDAVSPLCRTVYVGYSDVDPLSDQTNPLSPAYTSPLARGRIVSGRSSQSFSSTQVAEDLSSVVSTSSEEDNARTERHRKRCDALALPMGSPLVQTATLNALLQMANENKKEMDAKATIGTVPALRDYHFFLMHVLTNTIVAKQAIASGEVQRALGTTKADYLLTVLKCVVPMPELVQLGFQFVNNAKVVTECNHVLINLRAILGGILSEEIISKFVTELALLDERSIRALPTSIDSRNDFIKMVDDLRQRAAGRTFIQDNLVARRAMLDLAVIISILSKPNCPKNKDQLIAAFKIELGARNPIARSSVTSVTSSSSSTATLYHPQSGQARTTVPAKQQANFAPHRFN